MKVYHLLATFALAVSAGSCVDPADPVRTETETQAASSSDCLGIYWANAPAPAYTQWNNTLPGNVSSDQIWLFVPMDGQLTTYGLYQINPGQKVVSWASLVPAASRPYAMYLATQRPGTQVSIRIPPPPPWPPGDQWTVADKAINFGFRAAYAAINTPPFP